ncbi:MAG: hypothetical protein R8P61_04945 [Bacteroidia bacterium]|nr:hypothetical protein [Bacteroidia bacterium]
MKQHTITSVFLLLVFHLCGFSQNLIIERIENCPNNIPIDPGKVSFLYFLEEGKQSPYLDWAEGYQIPGDSLKNWSCRYRTFKNSGFLEDEGTVYVKFAENDASHDSIYIDRMYVEIREDNSLDVKFAFRFVLYNNQIVRLSCSDSAPLDLAVLTLKFQYRKSFSEIDKMSPLPPPPPFDVNKQEEERHKLAIEKMSCPETIRSFSYKIKFKSRFNPIEVHYGEPFSIPFPGPDEEGKFALNLIDEEHGTSLIIQVEDDPGTALVSDEAYGEKLIAQISAAYEGNTFLGQDEVDNIGGLNFKRYRFKIFSGKWGPRIQEFLIFRNGDVFLKLICLYKENGPYRAQILELEQGLKLAFP